MNAFEAKKNLKAPGGPHKTWAHFVRMVLDELGWSRKETCDRLLVEPGWLKKALDGQDLDGLYRFRFQERLIQQWDEYRKDKPALGPIFFPSYIENAPWDVARTGENEKTTSSKQQPVDLAPSRIFFSGENGGLRHFTGRDNEFKALDSAWNGNASAWRDIYNRQFTQTERLLGQPYLPRIIVFKAWTGTGKTSLVTKWASDKLAKGDHSGIERYFDWSFQNQGKHNDATLLYQANYAELFFNEALQFFGDSNLANSNATAWQKGERLAKLVAEHRSLLILDGIEPLQDFKNGRLLDEGLRSLLRGLAVRNKGLCLITTRPNLSRIGISELSSWHETTAPEWDLAHLTDEPGAVLLTKLGVSGTHSEKCELSARLKGHPLTLTLLGNYLMRAHHGDIRRADFVDFRKINEKNQDGVAFKVIAAYERWFQQNNYMAEVTILRMLGLFDRPATPDCLAALCNPPVRGLSEIIGSFSDEELNDAMVNLAELNLVKRQPWMPQATWGYHEKLSRKAMEAAKNQHSISIGRPKLFTPSTSKVLFRYCLDSHPLVRSFFAESLKRRLRVWKAAHARLFEHLQKSAPYWPEGLNGLQPLYQAVVHGSLAGKYRRACDDVYRDRILRGANRIRGFYSWKMLGAYGTNLAVLFHFYEKQWSQLWDGFPRRKKAWLFHETAIQLRALGRIEDALPPSKSAFNIYRTLKDWREAAQSANNACELELTAGDIISAVKYGKRGTFFADRSRHLFRRFDVRSAYGDALHQIGRYTDAFTTFQEAEKLLKKLQPHQPLLYSHPGFRFCDLLLTKAERLARRVILNDNPPIYSASAEEINHCKAVEQRVSQTLKYAEKKHLSTFGLALDHLTFGKVLLYRAMLSISAYSSPREEKFKTDLIPEATNHISFAMDGFQRAGHSEFIVKVLLNRAWLWAAQDDSNLAQADLDKAQQIADRGPMQLLLADIHLCRSRLFRDKQELKLARKLIEHHNYRRRKQELEDAVEAARSW